MEPEPASIEEIKSGPMMAMKNDRGKTAAKDLIAEAAWRADGLRIAGPKMVAGTEVASNGEIVSGNNVAGLAVVLRRHLGWHAS